MLGKLRNWATRYIDGFVSATVIRPAKRRGKAALRKARYEMQAAKDLGYSLGQEDRDLRQWCVEQTAEGGKIRLQEATDLYLWVSQKTSAGNPLLTIKIKRPKKRG